MRRPTVAEAIGGGMGGIAAVRVISEARVVLVSPVSELIRRTPDDAWYYLAVARNLARGAGPTFDGRDRTNGFQPLWQFTEALLGTVWHETALVRAVLLTGQLMTIVAVLLIVAIASRVLDLGAVGIGLVAVIVASPPVWSRLCDGMETPTVLLALALLVWAIDRWWRSPTAWWFAVVGLASGACCLARTSTAVVIVLVPGLLLLLGPRGTPRPQAALRAIAGWVGGVVIVVAPWVVWSWLVVGTPIQVSSTVKSHWARSATGPIWSAAGLKQAYRAATEELWRQVRLGLDVANGTPSVLRRLVETVAAVGLVWLVARLVRRTRRSLVLVVPATVLVARVLAEFVTLPTLIATWYAAPLLVPSAVAGVAVAMGVARIGLDWSGRHAAQHLTLAAIGVVGLLLSLWVAFLPAGQPSGTWGLANLEAGRELDRLGGRAGAFDAGVVGWIHPGTVDLDGLVRSPGSVRRILRTPAGRVALDDHVTFLAGRMATDDPRVPSCARVLWTSSTVVSLPGQGSVPVRIWSLSACARSASSQRGGAAG